MTSQSEGAPPILVHHLKHNKALHQQIVLMTVATLNTPGFGDCAAVDVEPLGHGFVRVIARFGFMERPDVLAALDRARANGLDSLDVDTTFYLAHLTLIPTDRVGMPSWQEALFVFLSRNARRATSFYQIPADRVVEIGIQLEL